MLTRLIYRSNAVCRREDGLRICTDSCESNEVAGITGGLLLTQGVFVQYLEGPELAVSALCHRIQSDPRHSHCRIIDSRPASGRVFRSKPMQWLAMDGYTLSVISVLSPHDPQLTSINAVSGDALFQALAGASLRR